MPRKKEPLKGAAKKKRPKKSRIGKEVVKRPTHNPDAEHGAGDEERLLTYQEFAWECKVDGYSVANIAKLVQGKFNLEKAPAVGTIQNWLLSARKMRTDTTAALQEEFITTGLSRLERIIRQFMPIAKGDETIRIKRFEKQEDGSFEETIDEECFKERAEAAKVVMKAVDTGRRILGVGLSNSNDDEDDKGKVTVETLGPTIINVFNQTPELAKAIQVAKKNGTPVIGQLTLSSGNDDIDALP